jgi:hypothetical protein
MVKKKRSLKTLPKINILQTGFKLGLFARELLVAEIFFSLSKAGSAVGRSVFGMQNFRRFRLFKKPGGPLKKTQRLKDDCLRRGPGTKICSRPTLDSITSIFSVTYLLLYSVIALSEFLTCPSMSLVV